MGSMNVGKVSFGNAPQATTGTTQAAAQQPSAKKADKGDVVVIGGKEFTKKQAVIGGAGILASAAILATGIASYVRGKANLGAESKFIDKIKEGFHTIVNKDARANYKAARAAEKAAKEAGDKAATAAGEAAADKAAEAAKPETTPVEKAAAETKTEAPTPEAAAKAEEKAAGGAADGAKKALKSEELEQKAQNIQTKLDEQTKKLADLKAEQAVLDKRTNDLPSVIQKHKDEVELVKIELEEAKTNGASKKDIKKIKGELKAAQDKLDNTEKAQKEVAARKKAVDGQIKGLESQKSVDGRKKMEDSIKQINKQVVEAKKAEFKEGSEELKKLNSELDSLKAKRAELTGTDEATVRKQDQYDKAITSKEGKIKTYEQEADKLVESKINLDAKESEIAALQEEIKGASKADKPALEAKLKTLKDEKAKLSTAYSDADIALYKLAGGAKKA